MKLSLKSRFTIEDPFLIVSANIEPV